MGTRVDHWGMYPHTSTFDRVTPLQGCALFVGRKTQEDPFLLPSLDTENSSFVEQIIDDFARQAAIGETVLAA
jgi:hypothetical protein